MKIWQRYLFFRLLKSFILILLAIFFLFVFVDLATRGGKIFGKQLFSGIDTTVYYLNQFSNYLHLFFPLSFILSSIHVLLDLNTHHELTALQMGGLSRKKLLTPFFALASILIFLTLVNYQWITPRASVGAGDYIKAHARHKKKPLRTNLHTITSADETEIVFQKFNEEKKELFDVFWLEKESSIWHMKFFQVDSGTARFVDHFERLDQRWTRTGRYETRSFPQILIDEKNAFRTFIPYERRPFLELFASSCMKNSERPKVLSHLLYKLSSPLLIFLSLIALSPFCFSFSREKSSFMILALSLFSFLVIMMIFDGLLILGENQVIPAGIAFGAPLLILSVLFYRPFARL